MRIALRMGMVAEKYFGKLNSSDLALHVTGSLCLGDVLQGLARARLGNPPRFSFILAGDTQKSVWRKGDKVLTIKLIRYLDSLSRINDTANEELFSIQMNTTFKS